MLKQIQLKWLCPLLLILTLSSFTWAQTVSGKVTSDEGEALPGVTVQIKNSSRGDITDTDGNYRISIQDGDEVLVFSYVGFATQQIAIGGRTVIDVSLATDYGSLDEVVVIGYGTQRERDLTSAIATVGNEEIVKTPTAQAMQALQGKVAGVQIVSNGAPGGSPAVRVRGLGSFSTTDSETQPLYVVDGMFVDNLDFLSTVDIETISVLKDASASAIYGVRAANGVVLIETKSGQYNQPAQITYDGYYGVQVPQNVLKMSNSEQFYNYVSDYTDQSGNTADMAFIEAAIQHYGRSRVNPNLPNVNTDWYDEVLTRAAPIQNHNINISGGGSNTRYSVGASYFEQEGLIEHMRNSFERVNFRTKVDIHANDVLTVGGSVNLSNATQYNADNAVWFQTYYAVPHLSVFDPDNLNATPSMYGNAQQLGYRGRQNPFFVMENNDNRSNIGKILGNFYAYLQLIDNLSIKTSYNYNYQTVVQRNVDFAYNDGQTEFLNGLTRESSTTFNQIWDNVLTHSKFFNEHNVTVIAGYSYRSEVREGSRVRGEDIALLDRERESTWFIPTGGTINNDQSNDFGARVFGSSYFSRLAYNYDGKYFVYGTFRRDGTNKFQQKWGNFYTIGGGWIVTEESFFNVPSIDFLKIRGGWGQMGNDGIAPAVGQVTYESASTAIDDVLVTGINGDNIFDFINRWETVVETNVGLSATAFGERLTVEADYYVRDTEDAVISIFQPAVRGSERRNAGVIRNSGFEFTANWNGQINSDISFSVAGNFTTLKNEVINLGGQSFIDAGSAELRQRSAVGSSFEEFYGYEIVGVFQTVEEITSSGLTNEFITDNNLVPGDFNFKDQNGDGIIDSSDRVFLGSYLPDIYYGFNIGFNYKSLSFTANFQGQSGNKILNRKRAEVRVTPDANLDADLTTGFWTGPGTSNTYPSATGYRKPYNHNQMSEFYIEGGDYFRIQNVRLAYNINNKSVLGVEVPNTTIIFTAERPLTVFDYNGFNPEVRDGIDRQTYPIPAVYTLGLNVKL